ncbi:MAG: ROK family protein [Bacteroidetes bacterium]|jgi:glucokinase|nr:ROK family protein [Bacteroidota bacterium]MBT3750467.1 ROK family protein [Bacteroidota bacterium]MBT4398857.1 ROK family protein [Bacteroidota bacterium]MBT4411614.1 ROK family protein [Bacteroidota bacterium]MBT5427425.1 ROK family protein [Bacteroidota bacterium]
MIKVSLGVDIGGTNTDFAFVDRDGKILVEDRISTRAFEEVEVYLGALNEKVRLACRRLPGKAEIIGIGIGAPMGNINKGTIEHSADLPWKGVVPLADLIRAHTDVPVLVTNDANAAAVGEMVYGGAKGMKNFVVITLGTGLGSGFVVDGKLLYGQDGFAGEVGHTILRPGRTNRECGCGRLGCLETYVSATGITRTLLKILADSIQESELRNYRLNELTSLHISEAALKGDKLAKMAFEHTGEMLGVKLADLVAHTNPEAIFLFGGLALSKGLIFDPTKRHFEKNLLTIYRNKVKLLPSQLNSQNAAVLGASALAWDAFENNK